MSKKYSSKEIVDIATSAAIVTRSLKVALVVGSVLMAINHGDALLSGHVEPQRIMKILLTYCVPYLVSTYAGVVATMETKNH